MSSSKDLSWHQVSMLFQCLDYGSDELLHVACLLKAEEDEQAVRLGVNLASDIEKDAALESRFRLQSIANVDCLGYETFLFNSEIYGFFTGDKEMVNLDYLYQSCLGRELGVMDRTVETEIPCEAWPDAVRAHNNEVLSKALTGRYEPPQIQDSYFLIEANFLNGPVPLLREHSLFLRPVEKGRSIEAQAFEFLMTKQREAEEGQRGEKQLEAILKLERWPSSGLLSGMLVSVHCFEKSTGVSFEAVDEGRGGRLILKDDKGQRMVAMTVEEIRED